MDGSSEDTDTPRGLIQRMLKHSNVEERVAKPTSSRRFFRTPRQQRTIATAAAQANKRRHVSASSTEPSSKRTRTDADSSATPRTLIEQMIGEENSTEQTVRVKSRVTRATKKTPTGNVSRSEVSSLRKKVALRQLTRSTVDESTPRGLIEGFMQHGDASATFVVDTPEAKEESPDLVNVSLAPRRRRQSSLGESFFISSSAPEPRHMTNRGPFGRQRVVTQPPAFVQPTEIERDVEQLDDHISFTTNLHPDKTVNATQGEKTEEYTKSLAQRPLPQITPGFSLREMPSLDSPDLEPLATESKIENSARGSSLSFRSPSSEPLTSPVVAPGNTSRQSRASTSRISLRRSANRISLDVSSNQTRTTGTQYSPRSATTTRNSLSSSVTTTSQMQNSSYEEETEERNRQSRRSTARDHVTSALPSRNNSRQNGVVDDGDNDNIDDISDDEEGSDADEADENEALANEENETEEPDVDEKETEIEIETEDLDQNESLNTDKEQDEEGSNDGDLVIPKAQSASFQNSERQSDNETESHGKNSTTNKTARSGKSVGNASNYRSMANDGVSLAETLGGWVEMSKRSSVGSASKYRSIANDDHDEGSMTERSKSRAEISKPSSVANASKSRSDDNNIKDATSLAEHSEGVELSKRTSVGVGLSVASIRQSRRSSAASGAGAEETTDPTLNGFSDLGEEEEGSTMATDATSTLRGYDTLRTPHVATPAPASLASRRRSTATSARKGATPRTEPVAPETSKAVPTAKGRRGTGRAVKDEARARRFPRSLTKSIFTHFTTLTVSRDTLDTVEKVADKYWSNLVSDLEAFATHGHRSTVDEADIQLLMTRQGFISERESLHTMIEKFLPLEYRHELIPIARPGNVIVPKPKK